MVRIILATLGLAATVLAQQTSDTTFDPSTAPRYGPSGIIYPTPAQTTPKPAATPMPTPVPSSSAPASPATLSTLVSSAASNSTASSSAVVSVSRVATSSVASARPSLPVQSNAAVAGHFPGFVGVLAGGIVAGLAFA